MACDTPARIAVIGAGPLGIEAALYGRFLGYEVAVFEKGRLAESVAALGDEALGQPFSALSSTLGLAAIESQDEAFAPPAPSEMLAASQWIDRYLAPLAATDLLDGCIRLQTAVVRVEAFPRDDEEREPDEWAPDRFKLYLGSPQGDDEYSAAIVIDTTGIESPPVPHFHRLGAGEKRPTFPEGLAQIRQLFSLIGGRETLDLYAGAVSLLKKR
jgi:hypothetical protein